MAKQKQKQKQTQKQKQQKQLSLEAFFVKYITLLTHHNTEVARERGKLPPLPQCGETKGNRKCKGTLVPLDTPEGESTHPEKALCDKCGTEQKYAYIWTRQNFAGLKSEAGNPPPESLQSAFRTFTERGLVELPSYIAALERDKQYVPAIQHVAGKSEESPWADDPWSAPVQQRAMGGGFSVGVTEVVKLAAKGRAAPKVKQSNEALLARLDF